MTRKMLPHTARYVRWNAANSGVFVIVLPLRMMNWCTEKGFIKSWYALRSPRDNRDHTQLQQRSATRMGQRQYYDFGYTLLAHGYHKQGQKGTRRRGALDAVGQSHKRVEWKRCCQR